ncbi:MAG: VWA domain-containing protein, partial [Bacteroidota bacterium]|nr:VWA domain-containing protein [Bacteroidota bacterium]
MPAITTSFHRCCHSSAFIRSFFHHAIIVVCLTFVLFPYSLGAQTDFAPGDIMFTGFDSDDPDAFSFVLLTDVVANTTIYITDRGWDNSTGDGFRDDNSGEGTISFLFTAGYSCGTEIFFSRNTTPSPDVWEARDEMGVMIGTVTTITATSESPSQDVDGPELSCSAFGCSQGDQIFIYQEPEPTPAVQGSFVAAIQYNGTGWNGDNDTDANSEKPTAFTDGQVVRFSLELDNAKYDCDPRNGLPSFLRSVITNDNGAGGNFSNLLNNWQEDDNNINLAVPCDFCCGATATFPVLDAPNQVNTNSTFTITIIGSLTPGFTWQLYTAGCGSGAPIQTTTGTSFTITAPGTQQTVTYYIKTSENLTCPTNCANTTVCFVADILAPCTDCSGNQTTCGNCFMPEPYQNPAVESGCFEMRLIFVLDESGSIGSNAGLVESGVMAFLNAMNGQQVQMALIEFSNEARIVTNYTLIDLTLINAIQGYFDGIPYNGQTYNPANSGGSGNGTNWHDAMIKADAMLNPDFLFFFTDGVPTGWNTTWNDCGNGGSTQTPEIVNPVKLANKIKSEETHMFMLGVGTNIPQVNLIAMSGAVQYQPGMNTIGEADWSIGDFNNLASDLEAFVLELCRTEVTLTKEITGPACNGTVEFLFTVTNIGTESSTGTIFLNDTFPNGYTNINYTGPGIKICPWVTPCPPPLFPNAFSYQMPPIPPGQSITLLLTATVLMSGEHENVAWVFGENIGTVSDTFPGNNISDNLPPTIMCPPAITIACSSSILPAVTGNAIATDPDGTSPVVTYTDVTIGGSCPNEYSIQRTFRATDGCNNMATCVQQIVLDDFTNPNINCPPNITVQCTS